jgi:hypothetical protein
VARLIKLFSTLLAGLLLGLGLTYFTTTTQPLLGAVRSGVWTAWPSSGSPEPDPYSKAVFAREGRIPLAAASGLRFLATRDEDGAALVGSCSYQLGGPTPPAQFWTLTLLGPDGFVPPQAPERRGFTSAELLRAGDGSFTIDVAAQARPGNWLPVSGEGRFTLMLSFYETPLSTAIQTGSPAPPLPTIVKTSCR